MTKERLQPESKLWRFSHSLYQAVFPNKLLYYEGKEVSQEEIQRIISSFSRATENVFFIQIGSCDGCTDDPIHEFIVRDSWSGILVEPVKYVFDDLVRNYQSQKNLIFENIAISDTEECKDFWYLRKTDDLPYWYNQIGSFSLDHILKHENDIPNLKEYLIQESIECMSFNALLHKHKVEKVDLIHMDNEGYDFEIIKQIDFKKYQPKMILYEHFHFPESQQTECMTYLYSKGYNVIYDRLNSLALADDIKI
jgi:FkbM family methyltransferase